MARTWIISKENYKRAVWKNGLGHTDEIAIYPDTADLRRGDFLWRLSSARIERASPFSAFPEHDRTLVILKGEGIRLFHRFEEAGGEEEVELSPLSAYEFPGDVPSRCELVSSAVTDLSVIARKAQIEVLTEVLQVEEGTELGWMPSGRWNFAIAVAGSFEIAAPFGGSADQVAEGDTLGLELDRPLSEDTPVQISARRGAGKLLLVCLQG